MLVRKVVTTTLRSAFRATVSDRISGSEAQWVVVEVVDANFKVAVTAVVLACVACLLLLLLLLLLCRLVGDGWWL